MIKSIFILTSFLSIILFSPQSAKAITLPLDFEESLYVNLGFAPTAMEFAPDGRLFVARQAGTLHVVQDEVLLPTPFLTVSVVPTSEQGLLGVAFDPNFATNRYVYVYYTSSATGQNRVSRFTASLTDPNVADPNSEFIVLDRIAGAAGYHNGGAIHFGSDGKLYIAVGDAHLSSNAQDLSTVAGKMLRINPDGTIPWDNPFVGNAGARGEVWAYGLRNPFTFAVHPTTGKVHINDVGERIWEEIDLGIAGANYGWPTCEGNFLQGSLINQCANPSFQNPLYAYQHSDVEGTCAITGGTFYKGSQFPLEYADNYFFADFCAGWIKTMKPDNTVANFASQANGYVVDLKVGPDGSLHYLSRESESVHKIKFVGDANKNPVAIATATPSAGLAPLTVTFSATGSSDPNGDPITYSWDFGDGSLNKTGENETYTYNSDGEFSAKLTVSDSKGGSDTKTLIIQVGNPPTANITLPTQGATYFAGNTIPFAAEASDVEDGTLDASSFSWIILFHHDTHTHPHVGPITGVKDGTFSIPIVGETSDNVWFRIYLTVIDSSGLKTTVSRDVLPIKTNLSFYTFPNGLDLNLDGRPIITPFSTVGVGGIERTIEAPFTQSLGDAIYKFASWSDNQAALHTISTPISDTTYIATYVAVPEQTSTIEYQVSGGGSDAHYRINNCIETKPDQFQNTSSNMRIGKSGGNCYDGEYVFSNVTIPDGAVIDDVRLELSVPYISGNSGSTVASQIYFENSANPQGYALSSFARRDRIRTSNFVGFNLTRGVSTIGLLTTENMQSAFQELYSQYSFAAGRSVGVIHLADIPSTANATNFSIDTYEKGSTLAPKLKITYTVVSTDITPPQRSNGKPTGLLAGGTSEVSLSLTTDEGAVCKYSTLSQTTYDTMSDAFATTGGTNHSTPITGLTDSNTYTYFVKCKDIENNVNPDDLTITFETGTPPLLTTINVTPSIATVSAGSSPQFTAQTLDQYGDNITASVSWSVSSDSSIGQSGIFNAQNTYIITAQSGGIVGTAKITVTNP